MRSPHPITRKDLDRLAVPAIISGIAEPLISLVDTAFVGRLGTADLAAVGISSSFFLLVLWVLAQTRSAVLSVVARYYGEQRLHDVEGLVPIAVWMNFGLGLLFSWSPAPWAEAIFPVVQRQEAVLEKAVAYFSVRSIGFPISLATFALTGAFRGIQNLSWSMWISLIGAGVNLLLNPLLIFGYGDLWMEWDRGLGMGRASPRRWSCSLAVVIVVRTRTPFALFPRTWRHPELLKLWLLSGNLFARTMALNACYYLGNRYATGYGEAYIGAHSIAMQIWLFSAFFIDGYAAAGSVLAGRLLGQGNWRELYRVSWQVVRISIWIGVGLAALYGLGARIAGMFTRDARVLDLFNAVFWMVVITQPINAVAFAFDGIFKGIGDGAGLRNALLFSTLLVFVPVILFGHYEDRKLFAVWTAFLLWMMARGIWLTVLFRRRYKHHSVAV